MFRGHTVLWLAPLVALSLSSHAAPGDIQWVDEIITSVIDTPSPATDSFSQDGVDFDLDYRFPDAPDNPATFQFDSYFVPAIINGGAQDGEGLVLPSFDASRDDLDQCIEYELSSDIPLRGLTTALQDIDSNAWRDVLLVEAGFGGTGEPATVTPGATPAAFTVDGGNAECTFIRDRHGAAGTTGTCLRAVAGFPTGITQPEGIADIAFDPDQWVDSLRVVYCPGDAPGDNPGGQLTALMDVLWLGTGVDRHDLQGYGAAAHELDNRIRIGAAVDADRNDQSSAGAIGDDNDADGDDEQGVNLPSSGLDNGMYTATVTATNQTANDALLCGWFDFSQSGDFQNQANSETGAGDPDPPSNPTAVAERSCTAVPAGTDNASFELDWMVNPGSRTNRGEFSFRFRLSTDPTFLDADTLAPTGTLVDGEVEDHTVNITSLPVSVAAFDSAWTGSGLRVEWTTVSETRNIGFEIWGRDGEGWRVLGDDMVPSQVSDAVTPQRYSVTLSGVGRGGLERIALTAIDTRGREEMYGMFEVGRRYGKAVQPASIDWSAVAAGNQQRLLQRGQSAQAGPIHGAGVDSGRVTAVDLRAADPGMQRVSYAQLRDAGLDLAGVDPAAIAVTLKGEPVARRVVIPQADASGGGGKDDRGGKGAGNAGVISSAVAGSSTGGDPGASDEGNFGPGASIHFWAVQPGLPDALYLADYTYRVEINPDKARRAVPLMAEAQSAPADGGGKTPNAAGDASAGQSDSGPGLLVVGARTAGGAAYPGPGPTRTHTEVVTVNEDNGYHFASPLADPWYAARLRAGASNDRHATTVDLDAALRDDLDAEITVTLAGLTDFPAAPDHRVQVSVNGELLADAQFDGRQVRELTAPVPAGLLQPGANAVEVFMPGGTGAAADIVLVDTVELSYKRALEARANRLLVDAVAPAGTLELSGFTDTVDTVAYAFDGQRLWTLPREAFGRGSLRVPALRIKDARYWVSTADRLQRPEVLGGVAEQDLLGAPANYLIIAHPSLMPPSAGADHPLNDYIAQREAEGWRVGLYDLAAIQVQYGHGMALPGAVTRFLEAAEQRFDYQHVLLVGDDSYDYRDHLGLGSVSFIPTRYTATTHIPHTPSDALLADLDGDGVGDKAIGRWPVRSDSDLEVVVQKTLDWQGATGGDQSALWVTDSEDARLPSFIDQAERMIDPLEQAGWPDSAIERVYFDQVEPGADQTRAEAARQAMVQAIESGKSLTGFVGHGAPSMWTFQGLLTPDDVSAIDNEGLPTLISTLTCYTSYFVSPHTDTLAHRLINGYREDAAGNPIPGVANGAVAIHGAATLSDYSGNETFARAVLEAQLEKGATLGAAIHSARQQAAGLGLDDVVRNWALLGDPTLVLAQAQK